MSCGPRPRWHSMAMGDDRHDSMTMGDERHDGPGTIKVLIAEVPALLAAVVRQAVDEELDMSRRAGGYDRGAREGAAPSV